ncbi:MAG TPA: hypothetical protein PK280_16105 [Planctomycetota bacterium]|nr:hypothetical protein [Planctomycetota bacterium]
MSSSCRIAGCRRKAHAHGLCQHHYDQQRKNQAMARPKAGGKAASAPAAAPAKARPGKASPAKPAPAAPAAAAGPSASGADDKKCCVPGCTNPHHARGYCKSHYGQLRRRGSIEEGAPASDAQPAVPFNREKRLAEIMKRHEILKKEIANIHKELESEADED